MTLFHYTAISRDGSPISGDIEAESRDAVIRHLIEIGHHPVEAVEVSGATRRAAFAGNLAFGATPSGGQITLFTRELAMLLKAGLTLSQAFAILETETTSPRMGRLVGRIAAGINEGKSLHDAFAACGPVFSPLYLNMVRVAEASGTLQTALARLAETREREQKLRGKALSALFYPAILMITAISAVLIMMIFVVPRFKDMLTGTGAPLTGSAAFVIAISDWLIAYGLQLALGLAGTVLAVALLWRFTGAGQFFAPLLLRLPLVGHLLRMQLTVRLCRTLGTLLANGVGLPEALSLARDALGNEAAAVVLDRMGEELRQGHDFTEPLRRSWIFPPMVVNMFRVGGETGHLAETSLYLAQFFEDRLDIAVQRLLTILEPVIIVLVSLCVGGIVVSIMGAVISLNDLAN